MSLYIIEETCDELSWISAICDSLGKALEIVITRLLKDKDFECSVEKVNSMDFESTPTDILDTTNEIRISRSNDSYHNLMKLARNNQISSKMITALEKYLKGQGLHHPNADECENAEETTSEIQSKPARHIHLLRIQYAKRAIRSNALLDELEWNKAKNEIYVDRFRLNHYYEFNKNSELVESILTIKL